MTNYREILRLSSLGLNHTQIVESSAISRPTVIAVLQRAAAQGLNWQAAEPLSDKELSDYFNAEFASTKWFYQIFCRFVPIT